MANIDEGAVLGGRYEITGRVMASAQRDRILTGLDQVLNREVLILVASRDNASQAAQSARQLATGERASSIQILDLGLSDDRTYLVAPSNADVEDLLALLTNHDVYVEPFFTEALGTELFGESRSHTPQTFDDDAEYYAELQDDLAGENQDPTNRPEFLNKLSDRIDDWLQEDDDTRVDPGPSGAGAAVGAAGAAGRTRDDQEDEQPAEPTKAELPIINAEAQHPTEQAAATPEPAADEQPTEMVDPITEEQEQAPFTAAAAAQQPVTSEPAPPRQDHAQRGPIPIPPPTARDDDPSPEEGYAIQYTEEKSHSTMGRWLAGLLLAAVLVGAVIISFQFLDTSEEEPPVATEPTTEAPVEEDTEEPVEEEPAGPEPVPASVERVVPDSPELSNEFDADLPAIIDGNQATTWHTYTFTTPQFGGLASNLALVVELEEQAPISEITMSQNQGSGGAFTVAVSNEPDPNGGVMITEGSFTGPEYTADAQDADGEPIEARYVIINFTELPTLSNTNSPERPYGLRITEIDVN